MKFYYKGQLVRTSKTHTYNWAILEEKDDGTLKVYGCRAERAAADAELTQVIRRGHPYAWASLCTGRSSGHRAEPSGADLRPVHEAGPRELR